MQTTQEILDNLQINWSVFAEDECRVLEKGIKNGHHEHLAAMISSVTPEKADEIAKIQAQLRPRAFQFKSKVQADFEKWLSINNGQLTPEIEAEWQKKMDVEREEALMRLTGGASAEITIKDTHTEILASNDLKNVKGLGEASINKLHASNIYSIDQLSRRTHEERRVILGPLVAANIKGFLDAQIIN